MIALLALLAGCSIPGGPQPASPDAPQPASPDEPADEHRSAPPNLLILLADDLGVDKVGVYGAADAPPTPHLDALAERGVRFTRAHTDPMCSPTRAGILTGRYNHRYQIGYPVQPGSRHELPLSETTLPEALPAYASAVVGKWHLSNGRDASHPLRSGFDHHAGPLYNLAAGKLADGRRQSFFHYRKAVDGEMGIAEGYATTDQVDDALGAMEQLAEPWLVYVAFNAPHSPFHVPPDDLHTRDLSASSSKAELYAADVEALDTEIGRLLQAVDLADTTVVFLGDNGTPKAVKTGPEQGRPGKRTLYDGGVRVPLIVAGPAVKRPGRAVDHLVQHTDLFATALDLAGVATEPPADATSLEPLLRDPGHGPIRELVYGARFLPNGPGPWAEDTRMIRDDRYKLIVTRAPTRSEELYDLQADPEETEDLLEHPTPAARSAQERLSKALDRLLSPPG